MEKIFEIPKDIVGYFLNCLQKISKYTIKYDGKKVIIIPRLEEQYYKPNIVIKDVDLFKGALTNFVNALNSFYSVHNNIERYHTLEFLFNNLLFNMTNSDAEDLTAFVNKRAQFYKEDIFRDIVNPQKITNINENDFYALRVLESPGLETPFCMLIKMKNDDHTYELPLIRYAFDDSNTCHIFAVQMGIDRNFNYQDENYKSVINKVNSGLNKYRNVPPNFVLSLALFLKLLNDRDIHNIIIPDYLFGRYRKYFKANTETRSNEILNRILNGFMNLLNRLDLQIDGFDIITYPNDVDSFMRIKINNLSSKNTMLNEILNENSNHL
jgi:hypothetical protein